MKRIIVLIILLLTVLTHPVYASDPPPLSTLVETLEARYRGIQDISANFSQTTVVKGFPKPQRGSGRLLIRRPAGSPPQFRFEYRTPRQTIVSDGSTLWFYQPEAASVIIQSLRGQQASGISRAVAFIADLGSIAQDFHINYASPARDAQGHVRIILTPKRTPLFKSLLLTLSKQLETAADGHEFPIIAAVLTDQSGTTTSFQYRDITINQGMTAGRFHFVPPPHTAVIRP